MLHKWATRLLKCAQVALRIEMFKNNVFMLQTRMSPYDTYLSMQWVYIQCAREYIALAY